MYMNRRNIGGGGSVCDVYQIFVTELFRYWNYCVVIIGTIVRDCQVTAGQEFTVGWCGDVLVGMGSKSATGLMEWPEPEGAMDAFVMANHQTIYSGSKNSNDSGSEGREERNPGLAGFFFDFLIF